MIDFDVAFCIYQLKTAFKLSLGSVFFSIWKKLIHH